MTDVLLTVAQVAARLALSVDAIYALVAPHGDLPCVRVHTARGKQHRGRIRIKAEDLDAWIVQHTATPEEPRAPKPTPSLVTQLPGADRFM